jgi:hypothetical protein
MSTWIPGALVLAAVAIGFYRYWPAPAVPVGSESFEHPDAGPRSASAAGISSHAPSDKAEERPDVTAQVHDRDFAAQFRVATDYLAFVRSAKPAAEAGDTQAQFLIYRALQFCRVEYPFFFRPRGRALTLDEGLPRSATRRLYNAEYAR